MSDEKLDDIIRNAIREKERRVAKKKQILIENRKKFKILENDTILGGSELFSKDLLNVHEAIDQCIKYLEQPLVSWSVAKEPYQHHSGLYNRKAKVNESQEKFTLIKKSKENEEIFEDPYIQEEDQTWNASV